MTDDVMKDLVTKHDATITQLVASVEHLVSSQAETNTQLKDISKYLAKQAVFSTRFDSMDKEFTGSFKRVHRRIDEIDDIQKNESGCNSVRLLTKDIESLTKDTIRLVGLSEDHRMSIEALQKVQSNYPSSGAIRWGVGIVILYAVTFGTYVVQSLNTLANTEVKITALVERDIIDINRLTIKVEKLVDRMTHEKK